MTQVGNTIYLIGDGAHSGGTISGRVRAFDLTTGTWSDKAPQKRPELLKRLRPFRHSTFPQTLSGAPCLRGIFRPAPLNGSIPWLRTASA